MPPLCFLLGLVFLQSDAGEAGGGQAQVTEIDLEDLLKVRVSGAMWDRDFDPSSGLSLQVYYDYTYRRHPLFEEVIHRGDLDCQHRVSPFEGHDLIWGLGYRAYRSGFDGSFLFGVEPNARSDDVMSAFVQDEISFVDDELRLTLGTKVENNDYSGLEVQRGVYASVRWRF